MAPATYVQGRNFQGGQACYDAPNNQTQPI